MQTGLYNMNKEYREAIKKVFYLGVESKPRGLVVKEINNYVFTLEHPAKCVSTLKPFHTRLDYAQTELEWYLSGSKHIIDLKSIKTGKSFAYLWEKFCDDDSGTVNSAYGQYIFNERFDCLIQTQNPNIVLENCSQWEWVKWKLRSDTNSRQAVININQLQHKTIPTKDFPCCIVMQFFIRDEKLHLTTVFRSQDVNTGLRNDVYTMAGLQRIMAKELKLDCGSFTNIALNLHLYEPDFNDASEAIK